MSDEEKMLAGDGANAPSEPTTPEPSAPADENDEAAEKLPDPVHGHRPPMEELQATFRIQQRAANEAALKHLAAQHPAVKELVEEVERLRAELEKLKETKGKKPRGS